MNKLLLRILLISLISTTFTMPARAADTSLKQPRRIVTGWLPYYSMKTSLPAVLNNSDLIQEVMPFWYTLKFDGKNKRAVVTDLYTPANPSVPMIGPLEQLRGAGIRIIPTVTDGMDKLVLSKLLLAPTSRTQVVKALTDLVELNNFSGVDLDFEGFAFVDGNTTWSTTAPGWIAFIKELSAALHANKKILSVTSPVHFALTEKQKGYTVYSWAAIAEYIDRLRIMTYDYSIANPGPIGPISWAERSVKYAISVMPASKVYLGLAGYGRDWVTAVSGVCPANVASVVKTGAKAATFVMRDASTLAQSYGAIPTYNETFTEVTFSYQKVYNGQTAAGLATTCTASRTAWYQDSRSYIARAALVSKYRLGGVTAWTLGMEDLAAMQGLRDVARAMAPDTVLANLTSDNSTLSYSDAFTLSGSLMLKDGVAVAGAPVSIQSKNSDGTWKTIHQLITAADGTFTFAVLAGKSNTFRAFSEGTWEKSEAISPEVSISVSRRISISSLGSVMSGESITVTGTIYPRTANSIVALKELKKGMWLNVSATSTNPRGEFTLIAPPHSRGIARLEVVAAQDVTWPEISSPTFSVIVR